MNAVAERASIAVMGYFGHNNMGDEAMLMCWADALRDLGRLDDLVAFTAAPQQTSHDLGIRAVPNIIPTSVRDYAVGYVGRNRRTFIAAFRTFRSCNTLLVGGGSLFQDRPSTSRYLRQLLRRIEMAKDLGQTVLALGVGVGPLYRGESRAMLRRALSRVDVIAVRDSTSRQLLDELKVTGPEVHTTADPVFLLMPKLGNEPQDYRVRRRAHGGDGARIALCLRTVDLRNGTFRDAIVQLGRYILDELDGSLWIIPMQMGGGEDDRQGSLEIARGLGHSDRVYIIDDLKGPKSAIARIAEMDLVIGEKLHSIVFAVGTHTPFLAISYAPKVRALAADIGHEDWCLDLEDVTSDELRRRFDAIWTRRESIGAELAIIASRQRQQALGNLDLLRRFLDSR